MILRRNLPGSFTGTGVWIAFCICLLASGLCGTGVAQTQPPTAFLSDGVSSSQSQPAATAKDTAGLRDSQAKGSITGTVTVQGGGVAVGAQVRLTRDGQPPLDVLSNDDGWYAFTNQPPGPFRLTITAEGFETTEYSGTLGAGAGVSVPDIVMAVARATIDVKVTGSVEEIATEQIKYQEQQKVFGFIPNFYASYVPDAAPLNSKQKFELAWKSTIAPFTFVAVGFLAGIEQATDEYGAYGQGAEGYAKRYGAAYTNVFAGTFIGSAILPSLLKQDPRYFYRGTGSTRSRLLYALGNAVICKGDNKQWQPNYSGLIGSFATGGISYIYTPEADRSPELLVQNSLIRIAESAVAGIFQEFVLRKLTPHLKKDPPPQP